MNSKEITRKKKYKTREGEEISNDFNIVGKDGVMVTPSGAKPEQNTLAITTTATAVAIRKWTTRIHRTSF